MVDQWVLASQKWVNSTYEGISGYVSAPETGVTGWGTIFALTRALQIELTITDRSDNFGAGTYSTLNSKYPSVTDGTPNKNIIAIIQCALWCKGYWGGTTWKTFDSQTSSAIAKMRTDMGIGAAAAITPKIFKSLLTMDAYIATSGGTALIRTIQQSLNSRYLSHADYYIIPCDGHFSRDVQKGLVFALQFEMEIVDGVANGEVGPMTRSKLKDNAPSTKPGVLDSTKYLVHLFQAALIFNGYYTAGPYDGSFSPAVVTAVKSFQTYAMLPVSGTGDYATWCSLLVSTGDPERTAVQGAKAADCSLDYVTATRAQLLKTNGYQIVGRYLTNTPVESYNNKKIQPNELSTITDAGLRVFPLFQEGGDGVDYFSYGQGYKAGQKAHAAARSYGFKADVTIYFAVDFDALEDEVYSNVVPYFQGIKDGLVSIDSKYKVGIYSARNTCRIVNSKGLASLCFLSGLSTAYSGNLGYPLPPAWAFDQVKEYTIGSGVDAMDIDKDIVSGRDTGVNAFDAPQNFLDYADWLYVQAVAFKPSSPGPTPDSPNDLTLQFLRSPQYTNWKWESLAGTVNKQFISFVQAKNRERVYHTVGPDLSTMMSVDHMIAAMTGARYYGVPTDKSASNVGDFLGWSGDLTQTFVDYANSRNSGEEPDPYSFCRAWIGRRGKFDADDHQADIDGYVLGLLTKGKTTSVSAAMRTYYTASSGGYRTRYKQFLDGRFGGSYTNAYNAAVHWLTTSDPVTVGIRTAFLVLDENKIVGPGASTLAEIRAISQAWADDLKFRITGK